MQNEKLLSVKDVQEILGISRDTAYRMVRDGEIESYRVGKLYKIKQDSLDNYIRSQKVQKT